MLLKFNANFVMNLWQLMNLWIIFKNAKESIGKFLCVPKFFQIQRIKIITPLHLILKMTNTK